MPKTSPNLMSCSIKMAHHMNYVYNGLCFQGYFFWKHYSVSIKMLHNELFQKFWFLFGTIFLGLRTFSNVNALHKCLLLQERAFRLGSWHLLKLAISIQPQKDLFLLCLNESRQPSDTASLCFIWSRKETPTLFTN